MPFTTLFFDLDDTLYPSGNGLWEAIRTRMSRYMSDRLGLPEDQVAALRRYYFQTYGTTLRGLQKHHQVDADEYLAYVHDIPLELYIKPDPALPKLLQSLPQQRYIFTNADADHARRVLKILGVGDCFDGIVDIRALEFACKPETLAYQRALRHAGNPDPVECMMLDDSIVNLEPAQRLGFTTVLIGMNNPPPPGNSYHAPSIHAIPALFPDLWNQLIAGARQGA